MLRSANILIKMAYNDNFESLQLKGVTELNCEELGHGAYGRKSLCGQVLPNNMCR